VDSLTVVIEEMDGSPVFSEKLGLTVAGNHQFNWDGKDDEGNLMGDGTYSIKLKTLTKDGESGTINAYNAGRISRVEYRKGQPWVKVSDAMIPLSKVTTVDNLSQRLFGDAVPLPIKEDLVPKGMFNDVGETKK
jgi:flagellar basal-body rod modification protein FlgD